MEKMILVPQFVDRGGNTVYHVHIDDPECRITRPGKLIGQVRFSPEQGFAEFEIIEQQDLPLDKPKGKKK